MKPVPADAGQVKKLFCEPDFLFRLNITLQVMAITEMSSGDQQPVAAFLERLDDEYGIHPPGAHHSHRPDVMRVLQSGYTRQISPGVSAPVA
jgi:hypothetical protein